MDTHQSSRRDFLQQSAGAVVLGAATPAALAAAAPASERSHPVHKVLLIVGDASETVDTLYPFFRVQEEGMVPVVAGPEKQRYNMVLHEVKPGWTITREYEGYTIEADIAFRDVVPAEYLGIFFSGGRAPEYLRYDKDLVRITRHFFAAEKPVAALCHGIEILTAADCIRGRNVTTVAKCALDAEQGGASYVNEPCVVDGNLVTARTWHDNTPLLATFVRMLRGG